MIAKIEAKVYPYLFSMALMNLHGCQMYSHASENRTGQPIQDFCQSVA